MSSCSKFLPKDYTSEDVIVVMAGRGDYPKLMIDRMRKANARICIIGFEGETSEQLFHSFPEHARKMTKVGQVGKALKALKEFGAKYTVLVGQIRPGKLFKGLHPDLKALSILNRLKERNAETIYSAIVEEFNAIGVDTLDGRVFIDDQLASAGIMTGGKMKIKNATLEHGIKMANEIARLDIGQGVVVKQGTVLCVEEFDGTDSMLKRAAKFDTDEKLFVKTVKPKQNFAIDVPVFGETTIASMIEGGIKSAALSTDQTIIINKERVIELAQQSGIQLIGF